MSEIVLQQADADLAPAELNTPSSGGIGRIRAAATAGLAGLLGRASATAHATADGMHDAVDLVTGPRLAVQPASDLGAVSVDALSRTEAARAFLYTRTHDSATELRLRLPSGSDVLIARG